MSGERGVTPIVQFIHRRGLRDFSQRGEVLHHEQVAHIDTLLTQLIGRTGVFATLSDRRVGPDPVASLYESLVASSYTPEPPYDKVALDIDPHRKSSNIITAFHAAVEINVPGKFPILDILTMPYEGGELLGFFVMPEPEKPNPVRFARFFKRNNRESAYMELEEMPLWDCVGDFYIEAFLWNVRETETSKKRDIHVQTFTFVGPQGSPDGDDGEPMPFLKAA